MPLKHIELSRPIEISLGPVYQCKICGKLLWTRKAPETNWQEWLFTIDEERHYKTRCNLAKTK